MDGYVMYGHHEDYTIDKEWSEDELSGDVSDEVLKYYNKHDVQEKYKDRALYDRNLLLPQYMTEKITSQYDLIQEYNKQYDKRKSEKKFGITYFDEWVISLISKLLKENIVR